jgi:arylformamidase
MSRSRIYDITIPVHDGLAVWPGDTPYHFQLGWKMRDGDSVNVGAVTMSCHTGTHADAPFHFLPEGDGIGALDVAPFVGPAFVVDVTGRSVISVEDIDRHGLDFYNLPRLLLKTGGWTDYTQFPETIPIIAPDVPDYLAEQGVILLGVDVPSVDAIDSKTLPNHHALAAAGIAILESLDLRHVPPDAYELSALPLRLMGADGSPVRAVLRGTFG